MPSNTKIKLSKLLKETKRDRRKIFHEMSAFSSKEHIDLPKNSKKKSNHRKSNELISLVKKDNAPKDRTEKSTHQRVDEATLLLLNEERERKNLLLLKECSDVLERQINFGFGYVKAGMGHLPDFLKIEMGAAIRPDIVLHYNVDDVQLDKELNKNCLKALACFFSYLKDVGFVWESIKDGIALKEECTEFVDFCKKNIKLFERFFPLSRKYKIFVEKLLEMVCEEVKTSTNGKNIFILRYNAFIEALEELYQMKCDDIFEEPDAFLSASKKEDFLYAFAKTTKPSPRKARIYKSFENKIFELLKNIKSQNISENTQDIKNKIKFLAEGAFNEASFQNEESFLETMKKEVFQSVNLELAKSRMTRTKDTWVEIKELILGKNIPVEISSIFINNNEVPEQYIPAVREFLGSVIEEKSKFLLGEWDSAKLPDDSKIRQGLVAVAMTNWAVYGLSKFYMQNISSEMSNLDNLRHSFSQLTEKERMAVMCTEVKCETKSFPLLPLLLLNSTKTSALMDIIKDFVPDFFKIEFKVSGEKKACNIIGLLEKMNDFYVEKSTDKDVCQEEKVLYDSFLYSLDSLIYRLTTIEKDLSSHKNKTKEPQTSEEKPSTLIHQAEKEEVRQVQHVVDF